MKTAILLITVFVISLSGCKKPPAVVATQKPANADLVLIALSSGTLSPSFAQGTFNYAASVDSIMRSITLTPTSNIADALITVNDNAVGSGYSSTNLALNEGDNTITTIVKNKDGSAAKTYTTIVTREHSTNPPAYTDSYKKWLAHKDSVRNSYTYTFDFTSWTEVGWVITISVKNGVIIKRDYTEWALSPTTHKKITTKTWHESGATLNTHGNQPVYFMTLDEIYMEAENDWLKVDPAKNTIYFETKNHGLISTCGYVPNGCADDCFVGIHITSITP